VKVSNLNKITKATASRMKDTEKKKLNDIREAQKSIKKIYIKLKFLFLGKRNKSRHKSP
jgi:hypothetical protein